MNYFKMPWHQYSNSWISHHTIWIVTDDSIDNDKCIGAIRMWFLVCSLRKFCYVGNPALNTLLLDCLENSPRNFVKLDSR